MIGHMGGSADLAYHTSVLERGVFIAFDRLGLDVIVSDSLRIACIVGLIGIGFARRIMLSHDYVPFFIGQDSAQIAAVRAVQPNWHYAHVLENVIPSLREAGVPESIRDTIMINNPRRLFA
jgi:phosphotriesterase-related protein